MDWIVENSVIASTLDEHQNWFSDVKNSAYFGIYSTIAPLFAAKDSFVGQFKGSIEEVQITDQSTVLGGALADTKITTSIWEDFDVTAVMSTEAGNTLFHSADTIYTRGDKWDGVFGRTSLTQATEKITSTVWSSTMYIDTTKIVLLPTGNVYLKGSPP